MNTPLDRLYTNLERIIRDALGPAVASTEQLTALAETLYLEVVAEYQPEPGIYGLADDVVEEDWATEGGE